MNPLGRPEISLDHRQQFTLPALSLEDDSVDDWEVDADPVVEIELERLLSLQNSQ